MGNFLSSKCEFHENHPYEKSNKYRKLSEISSDHPSICNAVNLMKVYNRDSETQFDKKLEQNRKNKLSDDDFDEWKQLKYQEKNAIIKYYKGLNGCETIRNGKKHKLHYYKDRDNE